MIDLNWSDLEFLCAYRKGCNLTTLNTCLTRNTTKDLPLRECQEWSEPADELKHIPYWLVRKGGKWELDPKCKGKFALFSAGDARERNRKYFINIFTREENYFFPLNESDNKLSHGRCLSNHIHIEQLQRAWETWGNSKATVPVPPSTHTLAWVSFNCSTVLPCVINAQTQPQQQQGKKEWEVKHTSGSWKQFLVTAHASASR